MGIFRYYIYLMNNNYKVMLYKLLKIYNIQLVQN